MENCISKINSEDWRNNADSFKKPFPDTFKLSPILKTINHVLNKNENGINKIIKFTNNNGQKNFEIKIYNSREAYTIEKYEKIEIKKLMFLK